MSDTPRVGLAYISDREDLYLPRCKASVEEHIDYPFVAVTTIDDRQHKLGMAGAVNAAWSWAVDNDLEFLLHWEEDQFIVRTLDIEDMVTVLDLNPELSHVVLNRYPYGGDIALGGPMKALGAEPKECTGCGAKWSTHKTLFSLNPCLIPRHVFELGYSNENEAGMTKVLLDQGYEFSFLGHPTDEPYISHIGDIRGAGWKL